MNKKNNKIKENTIIQQKIRKNKKNNGIITVTLELKKNEYEILKKISTFLCQGDIEPGQKKVIKIYSKLFSHFLKNFKEQIPKDKEAKKFYRRCAIAQFYKNTSELKSVDIIRELNAIQIKQNSKKVQLSNPLYCLEKKTKRQTKLSKKWDTQTFEKSLDKEFISNGIEKIESLIK